MKMCIAVLCLGVAWAAGCGGSGGGDEDGSDMDAAPDFGDAAGDETASDPDMVPGDPDVLEDDPGPDQPEDAPTDVEHEETPPAEGWLYTEGNKLYLSDGRVFHGRGANLHDTRSCNACTWLAPNAAEVNRRVDELVDVWNASFIRLDLESYDTDDGYRVHYLDIRSDPDYLADIHAIIDHIGTKPGVYVLMALWVHPDFSDLGWPTDDTIDVWRILAEEFADDSHVLYGLCNEPESNDDGSLDAQVWEVMNRNVAAIREVEDGLGSPYHIISVQGTGGWSRYLDYYVDHPITAGGGENIVYEVHVYNPETDHAWLFIEPSQHIPVIIGEFGPFYATVDECRLMMERAESREVPYLAWTFHMRCPPNLLVDYSEGGCGEDMTLEPTSDWGQAIMDRLAVPW